MSNPDEFVDGYFTVRPDYADDAPLKLRDMSAFDPDRLEPAPLPEELSELLRAPLGALIRQSFLKSLDRLLAVPRFAYTPMLPGWPAPSRITYRVEGA